MISPNVYVSLIGFKGNVEMKLVRRAWIGLTMPIRL